MNDNKQIEIVKSKVRDVYDFPKKGIVFKDITTVIKDAEALRIVIDWFIDKLKDKDIDYIVGLEARGFIFAPAVAYELGLGFVPIRKPGKLPAEVESESYDLEYGSDQIEIHKDAINKGDRIVIIDDLLATGGTAAAACNLIRKMGGEIVSIAFMMELADLEGRKKLPTDVEIMSFIEY